VVLDQLDSILTSFSRGILPPLKCQVYAETPYKLKPELCFAEFFGDFDPLGEEICAFSMLCAQPPSCFDGAKPLFLSTCYNHAIACYPTTHANSALCSLFCNYRVQQDKAHHRGLGQSNVPALHRQFLRLPQRMLPERLLQMRQNV
jgi:hypothetical protein